MSLVVNKYSKQSETLMEQLKDIRLVWWQRATGRRDFTDTFNPVIKLIIIRLILSLVVTNNWAIRQLDVTNAFLHEDL
jgi:Reverse transcriptase (RNA-dependent DNA polymerase)